MIWLKLLRFVTSQKIFELTLIIVSKGNYVSVSIFVSNKGVLHEFAFISYANYVLFMKLDGCVAFTTINYDLA
jgi:hypothetical protein